MDGPWHEMAGTGRGHGGVPFSPHRFGCGQVWGRLQLSPVRGRRRFHKRNQASSGAIMFFFFCRNVGHNPGRGRAPRPPRVRPQTGVRPPNCCPMGFASASREMQVKALRSFFEFWSHGPQKKLNKKTEAPFVQVESPQPKDRIATFEIAKTTISAAPIVCSGALRKRLPPRKNFYQPMAANHWAHQRF